jgi:TonB family protein
MILRASVSAVLALAIVGSSCEADADTSSISIVPQAAPDGTTAAIPAKAIEILDSDYPLLSLLGNEQGRVELNLIIDERGRVTSVQPLMSSGFARLDEQATQIVKTRWTFHPAERNGQSVETSIKAEVNWKLPLEPMQKLHVDIPAIPQDAVLPKAVSSHAITVNDYPIDSIRFSEQGNVVLRYAVQADGTVGEVQVAGTSSYDRLDQSATRIVKRWKFEPAAVDGKPITSWQSASVTYVIFGNFPGTRHCYVRPPGDDAQESVLLTASLIGGPPVGPILDRWAFVSREGAVSDVLIAGQSGLFRVSKSLVSQMAQNVTYPRPDKTSGCWYHDQVPLRR